MWIITKDNFSPRIGDPENAAGTKSADFDKDWWEEQPLESHQLFKMYDDDGGMMCEGIFIPSPNEVSEEGFGPLDEFGEGYYGCTEIHYLDPKTGKYFQL